MSNKFHAERQLGPISQDDLNLLDRAADRLVGGDLEGYLALEPALNASGIVVRMQQYGQQPKPDDNPKTLDPVAIYNKWNAATGRRPVVQPRQLGQV